MEWKCCDSRSRWVGSMNSLWGDRASFFVTCVYMLHGRLFMSRSSRRSPSRSIITVNTVEGCRSLRSSYFLHRSLNLRRYVWPHVRLMRQHCPLSHLYSKYRTKMHPAWIDFAVQYPATVMYSQRCPPTFGKTTIRELYIRPSWCQNPKILETQVVYPTAVKTWSKWKFTFNAYRRSYSSTIKKRVRQWRQENKAKQ